MLRQHVAIHKVLKKKLKFLKGEVLYSAQEYVALLLLLISQMYLEK